MNVVFYVSSFSFFIFIIRKKGVMNITLLDSNLFIFNIFVHNNVNLTKKKQKLN